MCILRNEEGFYSLFLFSSPSEMSDLNQKIKSWVDDFVGEGPVFLVDLQVSQGARRTLISILVDTEEGVTIDECALLSRKLGHHIEENEWIEEAYNLEVSSPGLDFPLTQGWQFKKNIGRQIKVWLVGEDPMVGELKGYSDEAVEVLVEKMVKHKKVVAKEATWFALAAVDKIKVQVTFQ
jgi:ribosome maturation factor RimP